MSLRRALAALALALAVVSCRDAVGPNTPTRASIAVAPILPSEAALADFGLTIDAVRFIVVRPAADTLADTTLVLPPDSNELAIDLRVAVVSVPETLEVSVVALSGTLPLFAGTRMVPVPSVLATSIPVDSFVGPVADSIVIQPQTAFIALNDSLRFQVLGFNGGVPVTQFYVAWSSSDSALAPINRFGVLRAPGTRGSVRVRARTPTGATDSVTATFAPPATQLVLISGGGQSDTVGSLLTTPLEVEARAADGGGVAGVAVRFKAFAGGGSVADSVVVTDAAGRARTTATLGGAIGTQSFQATVTGLAGSPVTFNATALAGPPVQLLAVQGDAQLAVVNGLLPISPRVQVRDAGGNPVAGVAITFTVASGGGTRTGGSQVSDSGGFATVGGWTLGTLAGTNSLTATGAGLTRTFTATGVAGAATLLVVSAGDLQSAVVGNALTTDPAVRAQDQFGNPVAGASIAFNVSGGGGSVTGAAQLTNAAGVATVGSWTLGTTVGGNTLTATLSGVSPVVFSATATAGGPTQIVKVSGDLQTSVVNTAVGTAPRVRLTDQFGNPVAGASVTFAVASGGGGVTGATQTTNAAGDATLGSWTLGTATGPNSVTATAGALSTTFGAIATPGAPTQIAHFAGNLQSAVVNAVLPTAPTVVVRDQFNNTVPGITITFAVDSGGGSITGATPVTDTTGKASVGSWRLGTVAGANVLSATGGGLTTTFSATGLAGPATQLVKVAGDGQSAVVGTALGTAPAVRALDQFGNGVASLSVTFAVTGGSGSLIGAIATTNGTGLATVGAWTLDTIAGANAVTASNGALSAVFTATGLVGAPNQIVKVLGDGQSGVVNTTLPVAPTVRLIDRYGNAISGDTIDFFVQTDGGFVTNPTVVTDAGGIASAGAWTIANFIGQNRLQGGVRGLPGVPAVQFTAQGTHDVAFQILRETVDTQTAIAGNAVNAPPAVRVRDQFFNPVPGVTVAFNLTGTLLGSVTPASAVTDSTGLAQVTTWTLDVIAGVNTLEADVPGLAGSPIVFSANGVTTAATSIAFGPAGGGNGQTGVVGTVLPTIYEVRVLDVGGAPVQNVQVAWAVGTGGGSISPPTSVTDVNGIASAIRTLGVAAGPQTATASVNGLSGSPVTFNATALPDVPAALVKVSADPQTATVATPVTAPVVQVTDQFGNLISGAQVSFAVAGGAIGATLDTTDATGNATAGSWTIGSLVGTNTVTVTSGALPSVSFTANGTAAAASVIALLDGNGQSGTVGQLLAAPYRVHVTDAFGNDASGATVRWSIATGGTGSIAPSSGPTDGLGVAAATHTLGTTVGSHSAIAWIAGLPDTVTFTSTAVAGAAAFIAKAAGDSQLATVNTAIATRPTVLVTDQFGAPVAGQSVTWAVATGGGSLGTPATVTSDGLGIATSPLWTLGTGAGTNTLTATAAGLSGSPVTFTATGLAGAATQMVIKDGNNQSAVVATALPIKPAVVVRDQFNNPVAGVSVTFAVTGGGGGITGATSTTDLQGVATVGSWTLGQVAGLNGNALRATASGVPGFVTFFASGVAGAPARLAFLAAPSRALAGNTITPAVQVAIQDQFGNTVPVSDFIRVDPGAVPTPGAKLTGTMNVAAVNGIAVFPDLAIDSAGIGYTLLASTPKIAGNEESGRFDVGGVIGAIAVTRLGPVAGALDVRSKKIYVPGSSLVSVLLDDKELLPQLQGLEAPFGVAANATTNQVYVSSLAGLAVIDGSRTPDVLRLVIPVGAGAKGVSVDERANFIYVAASDPVKGGPALVPVDGSKDLAVLSDVVPLPAAGSGVAFDPRGGFVYVAIPAFQEVVVIDPKPGGARVVTEIRNLGKGTYGVAVDTITNLLFVTNRDDNNVSVINLADFKEVARLPVGRTPEGLGVDAGRGVVYVGNYADGSVSFIDAVKLNVFATLSVGQTPKAAVVDPSTGRVYVPSQLDDVVRVIQP